MRHLLNIVLLASALSPAAAWSQQCGSLENAYGPFDYRTHRAVLGKMVEPYHFPPNVEFLRHGATGPFGADIDYTLRASPNHPRALMSMANLSIKLHNPQPPGAHYSVDCYFERAFRFVPDDATPHLIYGIYLDRIGKGREAIDQMKDSERLAPDDPKVHYNLGLVYFGAGDYPSALKEAHLAYRLGAQLPGLKEKLVAAGKWQDAGARTPVSADAEPPGAPPSVAPAERAK